MDRYARAGIPWYWEVELNSDRTAVASVRASARATLSVTDPSVKPLRPISYALIQEWHPADGDIVLPHPFDIRITWDDLAPERGKVYLTLSSQTLEAPEGCPPNAACDAKTKAA